MSIIRGGKSVPRPRKCRRVCCLPENTQFYPENKNDEDPIVLRVDEYETIRLIDFEGLSQEECSEYMDVARTTVQQIYADARKKVAQVLVLGKELKIQGGHYQLCHRKSCCCRCEKEKANENRNSCR